MADNLLPEYKKPPINEVACGLRFQPLSQFYLPYTGLFWEKIKKDFPECQHAQPLLSDSTVMTVDGITGLPLPRIWFLSANKQELVQLQPDCFFYNWRKLGEPGAYPRFPTIILSFKKLLQIFVAFLAEVKLSPVVPVRYELTYVNHIPKGEGWQSIEDIGNLLMDVRWDTRQGRFLPAPQNITWRAQFDLPDGAGTLSVSLNQVTRVTDQTPALRLDIQATGIPKDTSLDALWPWFELAHTWIVKGFEDLTHPETQSKVWEKKVVRK